jgi:3-dehydroquinate synthase
MFLQEMNDAIRRHKQLMKSYPRNGEGLEAYVDSSDTRYTENAKMEEEKVLEAAAKKAGQLNGANGHIKAEVNEYSEKIASNGSAEHINTSTIKVVS